MPANLPPENFKLYADKVDPKIMNAGPKI